MENPAEQERLIDIRLEPARNLLEALPEITFDGFLRHLRSARESMSAEPLTHRECLATVFGQHRAAWVKLRRQTGVGIEIIDSFGRWQDKARRWEGCRPFMRQHGWSLFHVPVAAFGYVYWAALSMVPECQDRRAVLERSRDGMVRTRELREFGERVERLLRGSETVTPSLGYATVARLWLGDEDVSGDRPPALLPETEDEAQREGVLEYARHDYNPRPEILVSDRMVAARGRIPDLSSLRSETEGTKSRDRRLREKLNGR